MSPAACSYKPLECIASNFSCLCGLSQSTATAGPCAPERMTSLWHSPPGPAQTTRPSSWGQPSWPTTSTSSGRLHICAGRLLQLVLSVVKSTFVPANYRHFQFVYMLTLPLLLLSLSALWYQGCTWLQLWVDCNRNANRSLFYLSQACCLLA